MDDSLDFRPIMEHMRREEHLLGEIRRPVFSDERTCANCASHGVCWDNIDDPGTPENFECREGWNHQRFVNHMKSVFGQMCRNFSPSNPERRTIFREAEQRRNLHLRSKQKEENGWDAEENL